MRFRTLEICSAASIAIMMAGCSSFDGFEENGRWRYGNFCGEEHPLGNQLPRAEQIKKMVLDFKPKDDVDKACRDHDICYVICGQGFGACDDELEQQLRTIKIEAGGRSPWGRCTHLISDVRFFAMLNPTASDPDKAQWAGRVLTTVAGAPLALATKALADISGSYPAEDQQCLDTGGQFKDFYWLERPPQTLTQRMFGVSPQPCSSDYNDITKVAKRLVDNSNKHNGAAGKQNRKKQNKSGQRRRGK